MVDFRLTLAVLFAMFIFLSAGAHAAPQAYLTEQVQAGYFWNGSLSSPVSRIGYLEVDTGSTQDVLQYVRLSLTSIAGTNLVSDTGFRNVAASPNFPADRTRIFVNTTNSTEDLAYQITDAGLAPVIGMRLAFSNQIGGRDIVPGRNVLSFNITLAASQALSGVSLIVQARRNTFGMNDSINFTSVSAGSGSAQLQDSDGDGFYDRIYWTGNLPAGDYVIYFTGAVIPDVNFDETLMYSNMDEGQTSCTYSGYQTFTGATFSGRFSRGPVREGIEMIQLGTWVARGFIKNIASDTTYMLNGWELYEIGNPVPVLNSSIHTSIYPGDTKYTDWYDSGVTDKPAYFSSSFNWEVAWGASNYRGISSSSMTMPVLYEMDSWPDATTVLQSNSAGGRSVRVNITTRHLGYSGISVNSANVNSTLPRLSSEGLSTTWTPSTIRVYYSNASGAYDITPFATIQTQNSGSGNGFVYAEVQDIFSALGHYMQQNDYITVSYIASSPASSSNENYTFSTNTTLVTLSGTPVTKTIEPSLTIPGVVIPTEPGGGGGGGGPPAAAYADIVKESADAYFVTAGTVKVVVIAGVIDSGDKGIKDVKVLAYVPKDASLDATSAVLRIYHNSTNRWEDLVLDRDFTVVDRGLTTIGKDEYREYLIKKVTPPGALSEQTIDMRNGDKIEADYKVDIPFGTSYLLTRIFGYNYYKDALIFEDAYTPVRRELSQLERLQVEEDEWSQGNAIVGKPVKWTKLFRVYNPNNVSVEEVMTTKVFQDSLAVELAEAGVADRTKLQLRGGNDTAVNWYARLGGKERKTYMIEADTPPVLETKREITVIESNRTAIRIIANMTMENFGRERYSNVTLLFPVKKEKILMISDATAVIEDSTDGVRIITPGFSGLEVRNLSLMYMETPPMLATTLNAIRFSCSDFAKVTIIVVPSEAELDSYIEMEVVGPEPNLITSHVEIVDLKGARPYQEMTTPIIISLSSFPSGKYFVYTKFNRNFVTILSDQKDFTIDCPGRDLKSISWMFVLLASFLVVSFLGIRVYRKRSYEKELAALRKKVKEI
jgi:hypothetical protein